MILTPIDIRAALKSLSEYGHNSLHFINQNANYYTYVQKGKLREFLGAQDFAGKSQDRLAQKLHAALQKFAKPQRSNSAEYHRWYRRNKSKEARLKEVERVREKRAALTDSDRKAMELRHKQNQRSKLTSEQRAEINAKRRADYAARSKKRRGIE